MPTFFEELSLYSFVNADSANLDELENLKENNIAPHDVTTNPTLILKAYNESEKTKKLVDEVVAAMNASGVSEDHIEDAMDHIAVSVGCEVLKLIKGKVSTELDARYSFSTEKTIEQGRKIISLYESNGVARDRVLLKIASTWEGIQAIKQLQKENINCNATLIFSLPQALAAADARAFVVSPFVGRISDWYKTREFETSQDAGVLLVKSVFTALKKLGSRTEVMAASFRSLDQALCLTGADMITLNPKFIHELGERQGELERVLDPTSALSSDIPIKHLDESSFRWVLNENTMASDLLSDGIRKFANDAKTLENVVRDRFSLPKIKEAVNPEEFTAGIGF
ncbi:hypothetical protein P9112_005910 [Eukaryota sp. TZLM1-RC]